MKGGFSEQVSTGVDVYQIRQPLGVVAGITPFNFPAMVPMWMFGNAIALRQHLHPQAVGEGPIAPRIFMAELLKEAGVPDGVFNVIQGDKVGRRRASSSIPTSPRSRSSARRPSPATSTRPARATASASRRSAAPRTT